MTRDHQASPPSSLPILDLGHADDPSKHSLLLEQLHDALFHVGFLYIKNHGVPESTILKLVHLLPSLFDLPDATKANLSKLNSPHFLGYSGYAEEMTLGKKDHREQYDFATELPALLPYDRPDSADTSIDLTKPYWMLRGPNQWPPEDLVPGFREAFTDYHDAVQALSYRFVHLVEEAFGIPVGTFDSFFLSRTRCTGRGEDGRLPPQHRIKLIKYPQNPESRSRQGVGAHKDSSGWLTFLHQVGQEKGLEVLNIKGDWLSAPPIEGTFVVNFGNAFEAATEGAVKATVHRVQAPSASANPRYSIPFFQGLPLELTVSEIRSFIPKAVRRLRYTAEQSDSNAQVSSFLDPRWDNLGESQLRKWIRSHADVGRKWYGDAVVEFYLK